eukprot:6175116-Pleurochrysis_carterae.AAC.1
MSYIRIRATSLNSLDVKFVLRLHKPTVRIQFHSLMTAVTEFSLPAVATACGSGYAYGQQAALAVCAVLLLVAVDVSVHESCMSGASLYKPTYVRSGPSEQQRKPEHWPLALLLVLPIFGASL